MSLQWTLKSCWLCKEIYNIDMIIAEWVAFSQISLTVMFNNISNTKGIMLVTFTTYIWTIQYLSWYHVKYNPQLFYTKRFGSFCFEIHKSLAMTIHKTYYVIHCSAFVKETKEYCFYPRFAHSAQMQYLIKMHLSCQTLIWTLKWHFPHLP